MSRIILIAGVALGFAAGAQARPDFVFEFTLDGAQEVPGPGDPDGTGTAKLTINTDTPVPTVSWEFTAQNILMPLTGAHIHSAPFGVAGPIVVDFSGQLTGSGLADSDLSNVVANPAGFYVNLHNADFPAGAIRGQIPAPATLALVGIALTVVARRRRP